MRSLSIAANGMLAQQLNVEVISNNLANMQTTAFKKQRAEFQDLIYQNQRPVGTATSSAGTVVPSGIQIGLGVKPAAISRITMQGELTSTNNPLDIAIQGHGYFRIQMPDGTTSYTRAGNFQVGPTGQIVTHDGYVLQPAITIPIEATSIAINSVGEVMVTTQNSTTPQNLGQLELINFPNPAGLLALGENLFQETPGSGTATTGIPGSQGFGALLQGFLETSNIDPVVEITKLVEAQRAYEMNSKVVQVSDEMMATANKLRG